MRRRDHIEAVTALGYKLDALLRNASLAVDGEQIAGVSFVNSGGGAVIDFAASMAPEIVEILERSDYAPKVAK